MSLVSLLAKRFDECVFPLPTGYDGLRDAQAAEELSCQFRQFRPLAQFWHALTSAAYSIRRTTVRDVFHFLPNTWVGCK